MSSVKPRPLIFLAFITAIACSVHIVESLVSRSLPLPFLRLGLSNVVVLYLVMEKQVWQAVVVNITKSLIGGVATFTFLTPGTILSLGAGLAAIAIMEMARRSRLGFSIYGISLAGATAHNLVQLLIIKWVVLHQRGVFMLTPILLFLGLISGLLIARIAQAVFPRINELRLVNNDL